MFRHRERQRASGGYSMLGSPGHSCHVQRHTYGGCFMLDVASSGRGKEPRGQQQEQDVAVRCAVPGKRPTAVTMHIAQGDGPACFSEKGLES